MNNKRRIKMDQDEKVEKQTVFKDVNGEDTEETKEEKQKTASGLDENVAGLLCYLLGFVTGIVFLLMENENRFIRYHAIQSIIVSVALIILNIILTAIPL